MGYGWCSDLLCNIIRQWYLAFPLRWRFSYLVCYDYYLHHYDCSSYGHRNFQPTCSNLLREEQASQSIEQYDAQRLVATQFYQNIRPHAVQKPYSTIWFFNVNRRWTHQKWRTPIHRGRAIRFSHILFISAAAGRVVLASSLIDPQASGISTTAKQWTGVCCYCGCVASSRIWKSLSVSQRASLMPASVDTSTSIFQLSS